MKVEVLPRLHCPYVTDFLSRVFFFVGGCEGLELGFPDELIAFQTAKSGEENPCASHCSIKGITSG